MKLGKQKYLVIVLVLSLTLGVVLLSGCDDTAAGDEEIKEIDLPYGNWACGTAKAYLVAGVLEQEMGYDVDTNNAEMGMIFGDIASGDQDFIVGAWLPVTHENYMEEYEDDIENLGTIYDGAKIGLVVPDYLDIESVEEMDEFVDDFEGEIVGIEEGAGIMQTTDTALEEYESLADYELLTSSEAAMVTELQEAIDNEDPIVVTGWTPHWKFSEWDLEFLDDPGGLYGESERIDAITREGFKEDHPEVGEFLENFYVDDEQLGEVMALIDETGEEEESALEWIEDNQDEVEQWVP